MSPSLKLQQCGGILARHSMNVRFIESFFAQERDEGGVSLHRRWIACLAVIRRNYCRINADSLDRVGDNSEWKRSPCVGGRDKASFEEDLVTIPELFLHERGHLDRWMFRVGNQNLANADLSCHRNQRDDLGDGQMAR